MTIDLVVNYKTDKITLYASAGVEAGLPNGAGLSMSSGFAFRVGSNPNDYADLTLTGTAQLPMIGPIGVSGQAAVRSPSFGRTYVNPREGLLVVGGFSISLSAIAGLPSLSAGTSTTMGTLSLGHITSLANSIAHPFDRLMYEAHRFCDGYR
jgi:hypothetical protein